MVSVCPFSSPTMSPWPMSHRSTLLSVAPEAKNFPLGEKSSAWIGPCGRWDMTVNTCCQSGCEQQRSAHIILTNSPSERTIIAWMNIKGYFNRTARIKQINCTVTRITAPSSWPCARWKCGHSCQLGHPTSGWCDRMTPSRCNWSWGGSGCMWRQRGDPKISEEAGSDLLPTGWHKKHSME